MEHLPLEHLLPRLPLLLEPLEQLLHLPQEQLTSANEIFSLLGCLLERVGGGEEQLTSASCRLLPRIVGHFLGRDPENQVDDNTLAAVGLVGDIYRAMADNWAERQTAVDHGAVATALMVLIQNTSHRSLRVSCLGTLADMALCLMAGFEPYGEPVLCLLAEAGQQEAEGTEGEAELLKCLADTYASLLQAGLEKTRLKKTSPVFFCFFGFFWGVLLLFAQKREFLGFFQFQKYF